MHHPTRTHVFHSTNGTSQLVKSSVNVTQMTSASLTSWNENISKRWIWKQKIFSWSWNMSVYCDRRPGSRVGPAMIIAGCLPILVFNSEGHWVEWGEEKFRYKGNCVTSISKQSQSSFTPPRGKKCLNSIQSATPTLRASVFFSCHSLNAPLALVKFHHHT